MELNDMPWETVEDMTLNSRSVYDKVSVKIAKAFTAKTKMYKQGWFLSNYYMVERNRMQ